MHDLPREIIQTMEAFRPEFSRRVWQWARVLLVGAILVPGQRTVAAILRVMGLSHQAQFQNYHRVLNRAVWSSWRLSRILLRLLVRTFVAEGEPVVVGLDETIERRRGEKIAAKGIYRDPVRSSKGHFVKASGLRWVVMMLLTPIPWAARVWALPFLSVLAPSERYHQQRGQRHKKVTDWGRQMILQLRHWLPERALVVVADNTYAVIELVAHCARLTRPITLITRLRLDAALYDPAPARQAGTLGRPRLKGARQPTLQRRLSDPHTTWQMASIPWYGRCERVVEVATGIAVWYHTGMTPAALRWVLIRDPLGKFAPQALLCTDQTARAEQIVGWFVLRWQLEVTFHEVRTHLGVETQRQWSDLAIVRTTPALLALFSLVTLFAQPLISDTSMPVRRAAWYPKSVATFSDTLALVRQHLWPVTLFPMSSSQPDMVQIPRALVQRLTDSLAYAV